MLGKSYDYAADRSMVNDMSSVHDDRGITDTESSKVLSNLWVIENLSVR